MILSTVKSVTGTVHYANCFKLEVLSPDKLIYVISFKEKHLERFKNQFKAGDMITISILPDSSNFNYKIVGATKLYQIVHEEELEEVVNL